MGFRNPAIALILCCVPTLGAAEKLSLMQRLERLERIVDAQGYQGYQAPQASGDLVITADIPLAAEVVAKGAQALDPRGELYTEANVGERLAVRNLFDELRSGGQITGGPSNFTAKDRQAFANQLDRLLTAAKE